MEINYDERCENCNFTRCVSYEEQCYECLFGFNYCRLRHLEKKKLVRLQDQIENVNDELTLEEYNETITEEKEKELIEKQNALCKEFNEYVDTLKKKGKVFYD